MMQDFSKFFEECDKAPRLNELADFFASTASGQSGMPLKRPTTDRRLLAKDEITRRFVSLHEQRRGPFDQHYHGSIPYRLEEECRLGSAILRYSQTMPGLFLLYSLGTAEGTMARTVSEMADGKIESLSCSPNVENQHSFMAYGDPPHASFFLGPFHHLTHQFMLSRSDLAKFGTGFDIILEDTTFQMYSPNRFDQVRFVSQHLKEGGLFIFVEKFRHEDDEEYRRRECQKDFGFKSRFFSPSAIKAKRETVLSMMNENEVTLSDFVETVGYFFAHIAVTWNSGNFYTLICCKSAQNISDFLSVLSPPAIPEEYVYADLPHRVSPAGNRKRAPPT